MFNSIGWGEIILLLLVGLFIFGPDRLPTMAKEAADGLKKVRGFVAGAKSQIRDEFGDEFADIDIRSLNPREFVRRQLLDDDPPPLIKRKPTPRAANGATRVDTTKPATARMANSEPAAPVELHKPTAEPVAEPASSATSPAPLPATALQSPPNGQAVPAPVLRYDDVT